MHLLQALTSDIVDVLAVLVSVGEGLYAVLDSEQVQTLFGTGAKIYAFSEDSEDADNVTVNFSTVAEGTIAANQPVLVNATKASTTSSIKEVTIKYEENPLTAGRNIDFVGLYAPTTVPEDDYFIGQGIFCFYLLFLCFN